MPVKDGPTARALRTLDLLRARPGITAADLGERLGVTERAARRAVATLRAADIPVESIRGPYGGYRLGRGATLAPVSFTSAEALALVMAILEAGWGGSEADLVGTALDKVIRALPPSVASAATILRTYAAAAPDRGSARPDPATASTLVEAVATRQQVVVGYRGATGQEWESLVDPWAVVVRHGRWYLLCHAHTADAVRTYRLDRILHVRPGEGTFTPPDGLDPVAALEENLGSGWEFATRVVVDAPHDQVARWVAPPMGRLEPLGADRCVLTGTTSNPAMYVEEWLARMPFAFRIEEGPELRAAAEALIDRLTRAVTPTGPSSVDSEPDHD